MTQATAASVRRWVVVGTIGLLLLFAPTWSRSATTSHATEFTSKP